MTAVSHAQGAELGVDADGAILPAVRWALARDLRIALRSRTELAVQLLFYVIVVSLFPMAMTPEPALRFFHTDETRVCRLLVVRVLGVVPAAVGVHDASESVFVRRPSGETARPAGLGRVPLSHAASMRANPAQALVAA